MPRCFPEQRPPRPTDSKFQSSFLGRDRSRTCQNKWHRPATAAATPPSGRLLLPGARLWFSSASQITDVFQFSQNGFDIDDQSESHQHGNDPADQLRDLSMVPVV